MHRIKLITKLIPILIIIGGTVGIPVNIHASQITIKAKLKPGEHFSLMYDGDKSLSFSNHTELNAEIVKTVQSDIPVVFKYALGYHQGGKFEIISHVFLIQPNDSLVLEKINRRDIVSTNKPPESVFIDHWIKLYNILEIGPSSRYKAGKMDSYFESTSKAFEANRMIINNLFIGKTIDHPTKEGWNLLNELNFNLSLFEPIARYKVKGLSEAYAKQAHKAIERLKYMQGVKSGEIHLLISNLCRFNLLKKGRDTKNISNVIDFYIENYKKIGDLTPEILNDIVSYTPVKLSRDYGINSLKVRKFLNKNFPSYSSDFLQENKLVFEKLNEVKLTDINGNYFTLKEVFEKNKNEYFLIDFWASWCAPCRYQMPYFVKWAKKYEQGNVSFLLISIDNESQKWRVAVKEESLSVNDQYLLIDHKESELYKFFRIFSIPRYILLNKKGKVISDRFFLPDDEKFDKSLAKITASN